MTEAPRGDPRPSGRPDAAASAVPREVAIHAAGVSLVATLTVPLNARGVVLCAHAGDGTRRSTRDRFVADHLNTRGVATLMLGLLNAGEADERERTGMLADEVSLLSSRLAEASDWVRDAEALATLPLGYFGSGSGAAAALVAAAARPAGVTAIVSRGGRPERAGDQLYRVTAPTLFIVDSGDPMVIGWNRVAFDVLRKKAETRLEIVPSAALPSEEASTLREVAALAADWFAHYLA